MLNLLLMAAGVVTTIPAAVLHRSGYAVCVFYTGLSVYIGPTLMFYTGGDVLWRRSAEARMNGDICVCTGRAGDFVMDAIYTRNEK